MDIVWPVSRAAGAVVIAYAVVQTGVRIGGITIAGRRCAGRRGFRGRNRHRVSCRRGRCNRMGWRDGSRRNRAGWRSGDRGTRRLGVRRYDPMRRRRCGARRRTDRRSRLGSRLGSRLRRRLRGRRNSRRARRDRAGFVRGLRRVASGMRTRASAAGQYRGHTYDERCHDMRARQSKPSAQNCPPDRTRGRRVRATRCGAMYAESGLYRY